MDTNNQAYSGVDRRKYPRVNADVTYSIKDSQSLKQMQGAKNISAGGIAFFARETVSVGSVLDLIMSFPDMSNVQTKVRVVWSDVAQVDGDAAICCELGVEFISLDEQIKKKISKYVFLRLDKK